MLTPFGKRASFSPKKLLQTQTISEAKFFSNRKGATKRNTGMLKSLDSFLELNSDAVESTHKKEIKFFKNTNVTEIRVFLHSLTFTANWT